MKALRKSKASQWVLVGFIGRIPNQIGRLGSDRNRRNRTMPGPGAHMVYAMGSGMALTALSDGKFSPHHTLVYTINAFFGPDIGSFSDWLSSVMGFSGSSIPDLIHHPLFYILLLGLPLCFFYSWISSLLLHKGILDSGFGVSLNIWQCLLLISAGSFSHFFLDHLFEENGHSSMYTWILSTGWWENRAPINPDAVMVVGFLCTSLIGGFVYINRVKSAKSISRQSYQSVKLIIVVATLYSMWCASQIYWASPRRPAVGEEADLGVLVFLAAFFFLPHYLCIKSMHPKNLEGRQLPL